MSSLSFEETPLFFRAGAETLFAVLTTPTAPSNTPGVVLLTGGSVIPSINRNRLWVKVARRLAARGHAVLRVDYHGVGESTGQLRGYGLEKQFFADLDGAAGALREAGAERYVIVGACFGARLAMAAGHRLEGLIGLVSIAPPVSDFEGGGEDFKLSDQVAKRSAGEILTRLKDPRYRKIYARILRGRAGVALARARATLRRSGGADEFLGRKFLSGVRRTLEAGVPMLFVYGDRDVFGRTFESALAGRVGALVHRSPSLFRNETIPGEVHRLLDLSNQLVILDRVGDWVSWAVDASDAASLRGTDVTT